MSEFDWVSISSDEPDRMIILFQADKESKTLRA